jgi:hypothetical protein
MEKGVNKELARGAKEGVFGHKLYCQLVYVYIIIV